MTQPAGSVIDRFPSNHGYAPKRLPILLFVIRRPPPRGRFQETIEMLWEVRCSSRRRLQFVASSNYPQRNQNGIEIKVLAARTKKIFANPLLARPPAPSSHGCSSITHHLQLRRGRLDRILILHRCGFDPLASLFL